MIRGVVSCRVALLLRSAEIKPLYRRFVRMNEFFPPIPTIHAHELLLPCSYLSWALSWQFWVWLFLSFLLSWGVGRGGGWSVVGVVIYITLTVEQLSDSSNFFGGGERKDQSVWERGNLKEAEMGWGARWGVMVCVCVCVWWTLNLGGTETTVLQRLGCSRVQVPGSAIRIGVEQGLQELQGS